MTNQTEYRGAEKTAVTTDVFIGSVDKAALLSSEVILSSFKTSETDGLSKEEAKRRLEIFGKNEIVHKSGVNPIRLFLNQFWSTVIALLLVASIVSYLSREFLQAAAIMSAVVINAVVGFITEYKAQVSLSALEKLSGPVARLRRGGTEIEIPANELVPGDVIILDAGSRIPADVRFISSAGLSVDESMLSGESISVYKDSQNEVDSLNANVGYQGSLVLSGRAKAVVIATGKSTKLGQLGQLLSEIHSKATPLESDLEKLGQQLSLLTIAVCAIVFIIGLLHRENITQMIQVAIALAVAAIPEGLPVVATLALASGTAKMVNLGVLIRKLSAVETLGCTQVICTDKTGTLTQNKMFVTDIVLADSHFSLSGSGYEPSGEFFKNESRTAPEEHSALLSLLSIATLCNDAKLEQHHDELEWRIHGDPTEGALLTAAQKAGVFQVQEKKMFPRTHEHPFELDRKRMSTIHSIDKNTSKVCVKGAPESVISVCDYYLSNEGVVALNDIPTKWFVDKYNELANRGLRVLALATKSMPTQQVKNISEAEKGLTLIGLVGMADQPKVGVKETIEQCQNAGIRVIMLTGDHPATAKAIGNELGITKSLSDDEVLNVSALNSTQKSDLQALLLKSSVLARVQPEMKLAIVQSLQSMGFVVAMTGDGINDAASLRQADIGVAMGQTGSSVAREASDMVLTDDNFASIVHAIEQGRNIYANISCAIAYLLTASLSSVFTVFAAVCLDTGLPLSPLQLLWLNLIMHIFPALGLVLQPSNPALMNEKPRGRNQNLLSKSDFKEIMLRSAIVSISTMAVALLFQETGSEKLRTVVLATLSLSLLLQSWSWYFRNRLSNGFKIGLLLNKTMLMTSALGLFLLLISVLPSPLQQILSTEVLNTFEWLLVLLFASISFGGTIFFSESKASIKS